MAAPTFAGRVADALALRLPESFAPTCEQQFTVAVLLPDGLQALCDARNPAHAGWALGVRNAHGDALLDVAVPVHPESMDDPGAIADVLAGMLTMYVALHVAGGPDA